MTENKRFTISDDVFNDGETIIDNESIAKDGGKQIYWTVEYVQLVKLVDLMNELHEENEQLKQQLQSRINDYDVALKTLQDLTERKLKENEKLKKELKRMYDVATLNKAIEVLENKYDKMLYEGSDEVKDAMRYTVLRCIEDLDELKDDITAR